MSDDHLCKVEGTGTVRIKMFDGMVRKLKEVRYISQVKKNLISIGTLKVLSHGVSISDNVLKMTRGSMVVLKGVQRNNLYYLIGRTVTGRVVTSISSGDVYTQVWYMRLGHIGEKSLQAPAKKELLKGASIYNMKLGGHDILDKKMKVKFSTTTHRSEGLLNYIHVSIWGPIKTA